MNIILKIILYFFLGIIILNVLLFLVLLYQTYKKEKSVSENVNYAITGIMMGYTYLFLGIHELIFGRKPYQPRGLLT